MFIRLFNYLFIFVVVVVVMMKKRMNKSGNSLHILIGRLLIQISRDLCQHSTNTVRMILMSNRHKQTIGWCINTFITMHS